MQPPWRRTRAQRRWNLTTDADLDDDLATDQLVLPERAVTPSPLNLPHDRTAEAFWHLLADTRAAGCDGQARPWDCDRRG